MSSQFCAHLSGIQMPAANGRLFGSFMASRSPIATVFRTVDGKKITQHFLIKRLLIKQAAMV
jgi:hypothetical protein